MSFLYFYSSQILILLLSFKHTILSQSDFPAVQEASKICKFCINKNIAETNDFSYLMEYTTEDDLVCGKEYVLPDGSYRHFKNFVTTEDAQNLKTSQGKLIQTLECYDFQILEANSLVKLGNPLANVPEKYFMFKRTANLTLELKFDSLKTNQIGKETLIEPFELEIWYSIEYYPIYMNKRLSSHEPDFKYVANTIHGIMESLFIPPFENNNEYTIYFMISSTWGSHFQMLIRENNSDEIGVQNNAFKYFALYLAIAFISGIMIFTILKLFKAFCCTCISSSNLLTDENILEASKVAGKGVSNTLTPLLV